jgi:polar amino acid transport system substrate-binding protein
MKGLKWLVVSVALVVGLSGCACYQQGAATGANTCASAPAINSIMSKGEVVVGMAGDMPPLNMKTKDGRLVGYEVDLAEAIAHYMGVKLRTVTMPFNDLLPALEEKKVDMVISGMTMTPQRNLRVAFVGPYYASGKSILAKTATLARVDEVSKIKAANVKVTALRGSTSEVFVQQTFPNVQYTPAATYDEAVKMVLDDRVHAMVADHPIVITSVLRYPGMSGLITPFTYEPIGVAVACNDPLLVNWLDNLMKHLEAMGEMKKMKARWFESASWIKDLL